MRLLIIGTHPSQTTGYSRVVHNIAKEIGNYNNIKCYIYYYDHKKYENGFCNIFFNPFTIDDKTIVVYPEVITGNPLKATHVVRWILLELGLDSPFDQYKKWNTTDLVYHWEPSEKSHTKQLVNMWLNPKIQLINPIGSRNKKCFAIKKNKHISHNLHKKGFSFYHNSDDTDIDSLSIDEAINSFNKCDTFYCYDPNTFFTIMAPLCGCITILHPVADTSRENYFKSRILCNNDFCYDAGIAYGNEEQEILKARASLPYAQDQFLKLTNSYKPTVLSFLDDAVDLCKNKHLANTVDNIFYKANP